MSQQDSAERIAQIISDYRLGEITPPDKAHVGRWIAQFPQSVRAPLLDETAHVLDRSYTAKTEVKRYLKGVISNPAIAGANPATFWRGVKFLRLQKVGNSQKDFLRLFDKLLQSIHSFGVEDCGVDPHTFVYLDDGVFSGGRVKSDLSRWISEEAPRQSKVAVIVMAIHSLGLYFAKQDIAKAVNSSGKDVQIEWWGGVTFEDRKSYMSEADVLRPKIIPPAVEPYVASLGAGPVLRTGDSIGELKLFSSPTGRELLEQEFLKGGVEVRRLCPHLNDYMRPLGCSLMKTTGFGTLFVTYRNIANNAPLVLWAGDPWYPLFPRKTN